jgi:hypothetical protein
MSSPAIAPSNTAQQAAIFALQQQVKSGANWFMWIAGLSVVNALIAVFNGGISFIVGLGVTLLIGEIGKELGSAGSVAGLVATVCIAVGFFFLGRFAGQAKRWAFIVGLVLYLGDTLLLLGLALLSGGLWLMFAFHIYALFRIWQGFSKLSELEKLQANVDAPVVSSSTT